MQKGFRKKLAILLCAVICMEASPLHVMAKDSGAVRNFVIRLYDKVLWRYPDTGGLIFWTGQLESGSMSAAEVVQRFFTSPEFASHNPSNYDYITILYLAMMGRRADNGGFLYWMEQLAAGKSRNYVLACFADSPEFTSLCASYGVVRGRISDDSNLTWLTADRFITELVKYSGCTYKLGADGPSSFDCASLIEYCLKQIGVSTNMSIGVPQTTWDWDSFIASGNAVMHFNGLSKKAALITKNLPVKQFAAESSKYRKGDLVIYYNKSGVSQHIAVYLGNYRTPADCATSLFSITGRDLSPFIVNCDVWNTWRIDANASFGKVLINNGISGVYLDSYTYRVIRIAN